MVRRRVNKAIVVEGGEEQKSVNGNLLENGEQLKSTVGCAHLEEQYFASPKRKDCKVEENNTTRSHPLANEEQQKNIEKEITHEKSKSTSSTNKARGGNGGRTIGVPLATRSQTRTIETFFKAKTTANAIKPVENSEANLLTNETLPATEDEPCSYTYEENFSPYSVTKEQPNTPDTPTELQEEENTTDTEYSSKVTEETVFGVDFLTYRSQLRDSHSSSGSTSTNISNTENIFLQEPVLTLNVDKIPNQATSIKINTSLDAAGPIFSSPPTLTSTFSGRFNQIVTLNNQISPEKHAPFFLKGTPRMAAHVLYNDENFVRNLLPEQEQQYRNGNINDNDSSSCDSGIAFTTSASLAHSNVLHREQNLDGILRAGDVAVVAGEQQICRRKPATPHRIVCPSPIKTCVPRVISPMHAAIVDGRISSPSGRNKLNKEQLSPRKSPRKMTKNIQTKTRRRLNQQREFSIALNSGEDLAAKMLINGCAMAKIDNNVEKLHDEEAVHCENLQATDITIQQQHKCTSYTDNLKNPQKQHQKPIGIKNHVVKLQPHKSKLQNGQPLVATNNNRDLTEFFPVRRSVRKTKTAVKEEMMRSLEKAILEEQADGMKVAYFEGKGRGIVADRHFQRGEFVVEYIGDLISMTEASEREKRYALDENAGCYMYYFKHKNQQYCIDATEDTGKLGRLVNHSRNGNLITKVVVVKQRPHLILLAKDDIEPGEELTYDYGDRSKESLLHHPWLAF
ncbi:histone-lysine N-methyltransferase Set8 [Eurosta solidaginis]|uniref:histone-lysine N-methyltransferase Set8 n=1 Tax=Eurosta solidaginis TaxID=178769 RepID=UPI0035309A32